MEEGIRVKVDEQNTIFPFTKVFKDLENGKMERKTACNFILQ